MSPCLFVSSLFSLLVDLSLWCHLLVLRASALVAFSFFSSYRLLLLTFLFLFLVSLLVVLFSLKEIARSNTRHKVRIKRQGATRQKEKQEARSKHYKPAKIEEPKRRSKTQPNKKITAHMTKESTGTQSEKPGARHKKKRTRSQFARASVVLMANTVCGIPKPTKLECRGSAPRRRATRPPFPLTMETLKCAFACPLMRRG